MCEATDKKSGFIKKDVDFSLSVNRDSHRVTHHSLSLPSLIACPRMTLSQHFAAIMTNHFFLHTLPLSELSVAEDFCVLSLQIGSDFTHDIL